MKIEKDILNCTNSLCIIFNQNVLILQNVLIPPNCILLMHSSTKYFSTPILYTTDTHFYGCSINIGSISFFSSSDMHQFHHLLGCHGTAINSSLNSFLSSFRFLNLWWLTKMLDKKSALTREKIKTICLTKKFFLIVIKITVFCN